MEMDICSDNLTDPEVEKVIQMSEETYCPVWSMLKGNVTVEVKYNITH
jgi:putative redox protein